jgi:hypothetical protein
MNNDEIRVSAMLGGAFCPYAGRACRTDCVMLHVDISTFGMEKTYKCSCKLIPGPDKEFMRMKFGENPQ